MGIANATGETLSDVQYPKERQRVLFWKRRPSQSGNGHLQSNRNISSDLHRHLNRRRLRRLFLAGKPTTNIKNQESDLKKRCYSFFRYTLLPLIIVVGISCCITMYQNKDAMSSFIERYTNQYRSIVNNKLNYCDRAMPLHEIFENIRADVLNQESALNQLEQAMANQSSIQSIALVGSSGLGKSLTMRLLQDHYPWKENVYSIAWNDFELDNDKARYNTVFYMLRNLAHCGRNLIIIDNMAPYDKIYVSTINAMLQQKTDVAFGSKDMDLKQLTIIYVFNLNRLLEEDLYERQVEIMQKVPETTVIHYRNFDVNDLEMCVHHEAKVVDMFVDQVHVQEMLNSIDVTVSGCKTVRSKVLIYARPLPEDLLEPNQANDTKINT